MDRATTDDQYQRHWHRESPINRHTLCSLSYSPAIFPLVSGQKTPERFRFEDAGPATVTASGF